MKIVEQFTENCHFYSSDKSLHIARACFRNAKASLEKIFVLF